MQWLRGRRWTAASKKLHLFFSRCFSTFFLKKSKSNLHLTKVLLQLGLDGWNLRLQFYFAFVQGWTLKIQPCTKPYRWWRYGGRFKHLEQVTKQLKTLNMADTTTAIVGGVATIISSVSTVLVKNYLDNKSKNEKIEEDVRVALYGIWGGKLNQFLEDALQTIDIKIELKATETGSLTGQGELLYKQKSYKLTIVGNYKSSRFLKLEYYNSNKAIHQFGTFIFRLSDDSTELNGHLVGYGQISKKIVSGSITLNKIP